MISCTHTRTLYTHLTEKSSFWGERRDYWHYLSEGIGELKALGSIIKKVQSQSQVLNPSFLKDKEHMVATLLVAPAHMWPCPMACNTLYTYIIFPMYQVTTGLGRGRALIRHCLCEGLLADCIQNAVSNSKRTK